MKKPAPDFIKEVLFSNAEDLGEAGIDTKTGHGRLTTDFIDTGRIVPDTPEDTPAWRYSDPEMVGSLSGCRGILAGLAVGALIWIVLYILIMWK